MTLLDHRSRLIVDWWSIFNENYFMVRTINKNQASKQRNKIIDTTEQLLADKGYDNTSVNDVIRSSGIAKGTFYHYFSSKDALLDHLL